MALRTLFFRVVRRTVVKCGLHPRARICICLAVLSGISGRAVAAEAVVYAENFSKAGDFNALGETTSGPYQGWRATGIANTDKRGYALARVLADEGGRHLSVQDFRWGGNPAGAEATTPVFSAGRYWRCEFVVQWQPHPLGKGDQKIEAQVSLINTLGGELVRLPFRSEGSGGSLCTGPGNLPLTAGDWYRVTLTKANLNDDRFDLEIECLSLGPGKKHQMKVGEHAVVKALPTEQPTKGDAVFAAMRFSAVAGWSNMGTLNVSEIRVTSTDHSAGPRREAGAQTLSARGYTLIVQPTGAVDLYAATKGQEAGKGLSPGVFVGGVSDYRWGNWVSAGSVPEIVVRQGRSMEQSRRRSAVEFSGIATSVADERIPWTEVELRFPPEKGGINPVVVRWTLMPSVARMDMWASQGKEAAEVGGSLLFARSADARFLEEEKPARWLHDPSGGVPVQETKGMVTVWQSGDTTWAVANAHGFRQLVDGDDRLNFWMGTIHQPWRSDELRGSIAFAFGQDEAAVAEQAVAVAAHDRVCLGLQADAPFYVYDHPGPIALRGVVSNLFHAAQRADVSWKAVDYDGEVIGTGSVSRWLEPFEIWRPEVTVTPEGTGPVYLDVVAKTDYGSEFQHICLGVLPRRDFADGEASRFGISAYRGTVGINGHTEARSQGQLFDLMSWMGVRWLRQTGDWKLAKAKGFHLWYHNNVPDGEATAAYFQGKPSWLSNPASRAAFIDGNLRTALDQGAEVFEFTNEWNLKGGEQKAALAEKYAKDWLPLIKARRDAIAPSIKLGGAVVANADLPFLQKIHDLGAWGDFDLLVFHDSGVPRSPDTDEDVYWSYLKTLSDIRKTLRLFGSKELWMTEFYSPTAPNTSVSNNERVSAQDLVLMVGLAVAADVRGMMYYCLDDFDRQEQIATPADVGEPIYRENYFGLLRRDWTPKAGLWAYATCAWMFEGARFLGDARLPGKTEGLVFEGKRGKFALIWDRSEGYLRQERSAPRNFHREPWEKFWTLETDLRLPVADRAAGLTVIDAVGRSTTVKPASDGVATLKVSGAPVFVIGADLQVERGKYSKLFYPEKGDRGP